MIKTAVAGTGVYNDNPCFGIVLHDKEDDKAMVMELKLEHHVMDAIQAIMLEVSESYQIPIVELQQTSLSSAICAAILEGIVYMLWDIKETGFYFYWNLDMQSLEEFLLSYEQAKEQMKEEDR